MIKVEKKPIPNSPYSKSSFLKLLWNLKIEEALNTYGKKEIEIEYNNKIRRVNKESWLRYVKLNILNDVTNILQFKIDNIKIENEDTKFRIHMICKESSGRFHLTEINVNNTWKNNFINKTTYSLINH